jgi:hypothetical protein
MIPYDDLCTAIATWRARSGLPVSGSPRPSRQLAAVAAPISAPPAFAPPPADELTASHEAAPEGDEYGEGTEIRDPSTGEIDVDAEQMEVVEEDGQ